MRRHSAGRGECHGGSPGTARLSGRCAKKKPRIVAGPAGQVCQLEYVYAGGHSAIAAGVTRDIILLPDTRSATLHAHRRRSSASCKNGPHFPRRLTTVGPFS
jgi:hypothetical protein